MIVDAKDKKKPLSHYLLKAEAAKRITDVVAKLLSLANSYLIISSLSVFYFGFYQLILSFISILRSLGIKFFDGLVALDMRRYFNVQKRDFAKKLFWENAVFKIGVAAVMTIAVFFGANIIANFYGRDIATLIKWASILLFINSFQSITSTFLQSIVSFSYQAVAVLREFLKLVLIASFLLFYQFTITEVIIAHVIGETAATLIFTAFVFIKRYPAVFQNIRAATERLMIPMIKTHGPRLFVIFGFKEILQDATPWLVKFFVNTEAVALYALAVNLTSFIQDFMPLAGVKPILALKADNLQELRFVFFRAIKYTFWLGVLFFAAGFLFVPPIVRFLFPDYGPAIPVFYVMISVLPLYGAVKVIHSTLASLREFKVLAMRLVNEVLILFVGSALLLPIMGVLGIGFVYLARHIERTWFLYGQLVKRYPDFKIRLWKLFRIDATDRKFIGEILSQSRGLLRFTQKT